MNETNEITVTVTAAQGGYLGFPLEARPLDGGLVGFFVKSIDPEGLAFGKLLANDQLLSINNIFVEEK